MSGVRLLTQTEPEVHGDSRLLVVVLHGLAKNLDDWCETIRDFLPNADLLVPRYGAHLLSNIAPRRVADQLAQYIHEADLNRTKRPAGGAYERIILIGHSGGALIIRKAYLIAVGYGDDEELIRYAQPLPWTQKVERIVLMAAINRGISTQKATHTSWIHYGIQRLGWATVPRLGLGKFLSHLRRGSPFIANLGWCKRTCNEVQ